jgi:N-methylhydantoinase B/oxoprolinase/acetone carboxylase alpha subunit
MVVPISILLSIIMWHSEDDLFDLEAKVGVAEDANQRIKQAHEGHGEAKVLQTIAKVEAYCNEKGTGGLLIELEEESHQVSITPKQYELADTYAMIQVRLKSMTFRMWP